MRVLLTPPSLEQALTWRFCAWSVHKKYFSQKKAALRAAFFFAVLPWAARCAAHMISALFQESLHDLNDQADDVDKQAVNGRNAAYF